MRWSVFCVECVVAAVCSLSAGQPSFTPLGVPPGDDGAVGLSISNDGAVVVGAVDILNRNQAWGGWVWHRGAGFRALPPRVGDDEAAAFAVSGDGARIAGVSVNYNNDTALAAVWDGAGALLRTGDIGGGDDRGIANGISRDGGVVVGTGASTEYGSEAFRFGDGGAVQGLGVLAGWDWSEAYAASTDGGLIVGMAYDSLLQFSAMYWRADTGMVDIGRLGGAFGAYAYGVSDDGRVIVGECLEEDTIQNNIYAHGFRWNAVEGMAELLPRPAGYVGSDAYCTNRDGTLIGGSLVDVNNRVSAMLWDAEHGCRRLDDVLIEAGLGARIAGWQLTDVSGMSADGASMVANGFSPSGTFEPVVVYLPRPVRCPADVDDGSGTGTPDGGVTIDDLLYYIQLFTDGDIRADLDNGTGTGTRDGGVTIDDLLYFVLRFEQGC